MLGAKYGFAQSMDCAAQTMDPYFVPAIHGLRIHICIYMYICLICLFFIFRAHARLAENQLAIFTLM